MYLPPFPPPPPESLWSYWLNGLRYTWRRMTGQLRSFPELRGMSYRTYRKTYVPRVQGR